MSNELPNWMKLFFLIGAIIDFIYGFIYLFLTSIFFEAAGLSKYVNPLCVFTTQTDGIVLTCMGIFNLMCIKINDWEKIKIYIQFAVLWITMTIVIYLVNLAPLSPLPAMALMNFSLSVILLIAFDLATIYAYMQMSKK